ncbi:MAG TPA: helix-turn-helix domain-containing protein [Kutzneria sp.]
MTTPRADARRNRELVLRTAGRLFAEDGLDVSLARVAQRAGVGAGTVYRHFPSKAILAEAVLADHVEGLVAAADRWASRAPAGEALLGFLAEVIERSADGQHVCDALTADRSWPHATLAGATLRFREALDQLLRNAKRSGVIRADVRTDDLTAIVVGGAALRSAHRSRSRGVQLVRMLLDGLRAPLVTKVAPFRDNSSGLRHETTAGNCAECGVPLTARTAGRPAHYCGAACRQRAHRRRVAVRDPMSH